MPLNTKNAGALTNKGQSATNTDSTVKVEIRKAVYIESIGRDGIVGETISISQKDAKFLLVKEYVKLSKAKSSDKD